MNKSNIKDTLSTIFGILAAVSGAIIVAIQSGYQLPAWLNTAAGLTAAISVAVIGYLTGKTPAAESKSTSQVIDQNQK
jgi:drug/metabolite transporter (DMT)-like permease